MKKLNLYLVLVSILFGNIQLLTAQDKIVHDAEYYIIEAQNGERWAEEDKELDKRLAELKKKHGKSPNIVYILWDDMAFGDDGIQLSTKLEDLIRQIATEWPKKESFFPECMLSLHALQLELHL